MITHEVKYYTSLKRISLEKLDDSGISVDVDDKLPDDITLKNAVMLMTCVSKVCCVIITVYIIWKEIFIYNLFMYMYVSISAHTHIYIN